MRTRCYCTNAACRRMVMRQAHNFRKLCPHCGSQMEPTQRLAGGTSSGRTHTVGVRFRPETARWLARQGPMATIVNEIVEAARARGEVRGAA